MRMSTAEGAAAAQDRRSRRYALPPGPGEAIVRANTKDRGIGFWVSVEHGGRKVFFQGDCPRDVRAEADRYVSRLGLQAVPA